MTEQGNRQRYAHQNSWASEDLVAALKVNPVGKPEEIVIRVAKSTAEKIRAIFAEPASTQAETHNE